MTRKTKAAPTSTISDRTYQGHQSWNREIIETMTHTDGRTDRVRYKVKVDAYDVQSYATAEVWRNDGWRQVHRIPGQALRTRASYVSRNVAPSVFDADITELRAVAAAVLA